MLEIRYNNAEETRRKQQMNGLALTLLVSSIGVCQPPLPDKAVIWDLKPIALPNNCALTWERIIAQTIDNKGNQAYQVDLMLQIPGKISGLEFQRPDTLICKSADHGLELKWTLKLSDLALENPLAGEVRFITYSRGNFWFAGQITLKGTQGNTKIVLQEPF